MGNSLVFSELTRSRVRFVCGLAGSCAVPEPWTNRRRSLRASSRRWAGCAAVVGERTREFVPDRAMESDSIVGSERRPHLFVSIQEAQEVAIERAILWVELWLTAHPRVDRSSRNLSTGPVSVLNGRRSLRPALRPRPLSQRRPSARPQTASSPSWALILLWITPQVARADRIRSRLQIAERPSAAGNRLTLRRMVRSAHTASAWPIRRSVCRPSTMNDWSPSVSGPNLVNSSGPSTCRVGRIEELDPFETASLE